MRMRFEPLFCPECGEMARGTLETVSGVAEFEVASDGSLEYTGLTDVSWDELATVADEGGNVRLVCPKGHDWAARETGGEERPLAGRAAEMPSRDSRSRACQYPGCRVAGLPEAMARLASGEWHCPQHGLLLAARGLIALYRVEGDADWAAISEIIAEVLPELVAKAQAQQRRTDQARMRRAP